VAGEFVTRQEVQAPDPSKFGDIFNEATSHEAVETAKPVEPPKVETPPVATPQAPDLSAIEAEIAKLGDGYSLQTIPAKVADLKRGMNEAQRQLAEKNREFTSVEPIIKQMRTDPEYARALERATQEYFQTPTGLPSAPPELRQAIDPLHMRITEVEAQLVDQRMNAKIDQLIQNGMPIDAETRQRIFDKVISTRSEDVEAHAWSILGPTLVKKAAEDAAKQIAEKIQAASKAAPPMGVGAAPGFVPKDVKAMSKEERDEAILVELRQQMG